MVHVARKAFFVVCLVLICQQSKVGQVGGRVTPHSRELENLSFGKVKYRQLLDLSGSLESNIQGCHAGCSVERS